MWKTISAADIKPETTVTPKTNDLAKEHNEEAASETRPTLKRRRVSESNGDQPELNTEQLEKTTTLTSKKFKRQQVEIVNQNGGRMKLRKLKATMLELTGDIDDTFNETFDDKLAKNSRLIVEGKYVHCRE
jgi:hypothetical protein